MAEEKSPGATAILAAASQLFSEQTYSSVSIAEIAQRACISKGNIFHHFSSKEELYIEVMQAATTGHAEFAEKLLDETGDVTSKLRQLYFHQLRSMSSNPSRTRLIQRELGADGNPEAQRLALQVLQSKFSAVVALFEQGRQRGEFRSSMRPESAAFMLIAAQCFFFNSRETFNFNPATQHLHDLDVFAEETFSLVINGIISATADSRAESALAPHAQRLCASTLGHQIP